MKRTEATAILNEAAKRYSVGLDDDMEDWWYHVLKNYKVQVLQSFIDEWYRTQRKMPMPPDFESQGFARTIEHQWLEMLRYVNTGRSESDKTTDKVVEEYLGGWSQVKATTVWNLNKMRETFAQAYRRLALQEGKE